MKKMLVVMSAFLISTAFGAPGKAKGHAAQGAPPITNPAGNVSNAPAGTPHASTDRDLGRDRALDAGKGKKKGLTKTHSNHRRAKRS